MHLLHGAHVHLRAALGLKNEEFEAMQGDFRNSPLFNEREKAIIAWSEAMTLNKAKSDEKLWQEMKRLFNNMEIVEISMAVGLFNMANRFNDTFWSELEPWNIISARRARSIAQWKISKLSPAASRLAGRARKAQGQRRGGLGIAMLRSIGLHELMVLGIVVGIQAAIVAIAFLSRRFAVGGRSGGLFARVAERWYRHHSLLQQVWSAAHCVR